MGPLEALNTLARNVAKDVRPFQLTIITPDGKPASTAPTSGQGSLVNQRMVADCGYHYDSSKPHADLLHDVPEAEVLIVPGGVGPPAGERDGVVEFIRQYYRKYLKGRKDRYLFTVCTGSGLAAQAGCLDGIYATTNKMVWNLIPDAEFAQKTYCKYFSPTRAALRPHVFADWLQGLPMQDGWIRTTCGPPLGSLRVLTA